MGLQGLKYILRGTTLCKLAVAMIANHLDGTFQISLVGYETLAEVVCLACGFQNLRLEE